MSRATLLHLLLIAFAAPFAYLVGAILPFNLLLVVVIAVGMIYGFRPALLWALWGGLFSNAFTVVGHGVLALSLAGVVVVVNMLLRVWFGTRSVFSAVVMGVVGTATFTAMNQGLAWFLSAMHFISFHPLFDATSTRAWAYDMGSVPIALGIIIFLIRKTSRRFRGAFLIRS